MKEYQLVIREQRHSKNNFSAYYSPADSPPKYALGQDVFFGDTIAELIREAKKGTPADGVVVYTYLDRK